MKTERTQRKIVTYHIQVICTTEFNSCVGMILRVPIMRKRKYMQNTNAATIGMSI